MEEGNRRDSSEHLGEMHARTWLKPLLRAQVQENREHIIVCDNTLRTVVVKDVQTTQLDITHQPDVIPLGLDVVRIRGPGFALSAPDEQTAYVGRMAQHRSSEYD